MSSKGSIYAQFRRAVDAGRAMDAYALATELRTITLGDALDLCVLLARAEDWRYERAAKRWLQRFTAEIHPSLHEVLIAGSALAELGQAPESEVARSTLMALIEP